ncbi:hypothetical protein ScPMuIL_014026 [Solemya velum]
MNGGHLALNSVTNDRRPSSIRAENGHRRDGGEDFVVPVFPMSVAVLCCIFNFIVPGFGSMIASMCVCCCAKTKDWTCGARFGLSCTLFWVGILQLLLTVCFLIGWVWSCVWGVSFVKISAEYYNGDRMESDMNGHAGMIHHTQRPRRNDQSSVAMDQTRPIRRMRLRPRSRISPLIYPIRAQSNIQYLSPPPPYRMYETPPPQYTEPVVTDIPENTPHSTNGTARLQNAVTANGAQVLMGECAVCHKTFDSSSTKFHCSHCGEIVCSRCYSKQVTIGRRRVKVCSACHVLINRRNSTSHVATVRGKMIRL